MADGKNSDHWCGKSRQCVGAPIYNTGHTVVIGARDPNKVKADRHDQEDVDVTTLQDAAVSADYIFLTIPEGVAADIGAGLGNVAGKTIVDCINPLT